MIKFFSRQQVSEVQAKPNFSADPALRIEQSDLRYFSIKRSGLEILRELSLVNFSDSPFSNGEIVGDKFILFDCVGTGEMAWVHRAGNISNSSEPDVAVKMFRKRDRDGKELNSESFLNSASNGSCLPRGYFPEVITSGVHQDFAYLVTEFISGRDLENVLKQSKHGLPYKLVMKIAAEVCCALQQAHAAGIIHRDIKPANIMATPEGEIKIIDWDLSWNKNLKGAQPQNQTVAGSYSYFRPEELRGAPSTERGDIYSLGCTMYALLTGRPFHFSDKRDESLKMQLANPTPDLIDCREYLPKQVEDIVIKAMSADPRHRFASMEEMRLDIEKAMKELNMPLYKKVMDYFTDFLINRAKSF